MPAHLPDILHRNIVLAAVVVGGLAGSFLLSRQADSQSWLVLALGICITLLSGLAVVLYWQQRHAQFSRRQQGLLDAARSGAD